ncbi:GTPase Era [Buchnera aphidicola (Phyllaphis fagi)]|uniref:GTPase Era n=1 Tax=Buchnera aphidicola TaxID=9 RepID=UPI003464A81D
MKKLSNTYCGYIGIFGKQNVGKSTLLNKIIGSKVSITSCKPGTTINNIIGITTKNNYQTIYIDTPGISIKKEKNFLYKNHNAFKNKENLKLIIFIINKTIWSKIDDIILKKIKMFSIPIILVINKIDCINDKTILLPFINTIKNKHNFNAIIPLSAKTEENIKILLKQVKKNIPKSIFDFPKHYKTNSSHLFMISEIIREKLMRFLGQELPYLITVKIDTYKINKLTGKCFIYALIFVKNDRHKKIVIGKKGEKIKYCSMLARKDIEKIIHKSTYLNLWVKKILNIV